MPGAVRLEVALREAYYGIPSPPVELAAVEEQPQAAEPVAEDKKKASPRSGSELTPLQRLKQRTYGEASQSTLVRK